MNDSSLFIAIPVKESYSPKAEMLLLFVTGAPDYLTKIESKEGSYWGKKIMAPISLEDLMATAQNVLSLVKRICPEQEFNENSLVILPDISLCKIL